MPTKTHPNRARVQEIAKFHGEGVILIDGHDDAIIGTGFIGGDLRVFYNSDKIIKTLMKESSSGMTHTDADEFFDFNIEPLSNMQGGPVFIEPIKP